MRIAPKNPKPGLTPFVFPVTKAQTIFHESSHLFAHTDDYKTGDSWSQMDKIPDDAWFIEGLVPSPDRRLSTLFYDLDGEAGRQW